MQQPRPQQRTSPRPAATTALSGNPGVRDEAFLHDEVGQKALCLASRGSAVIAELLRLADHIPAAFTAPQRTEYADIIMDFSYFKAREVIDKAIADSPELSKLDEEFWHTHMDLLSQFFKLFRAVLIYVTELNRFVDDLETQGAGTSIDGILNRSLGAVQLLSELHHLYGVMLLLLDDKIGGRTRERLIVSYVRYRGAGEAQLVDITRLCRATGYEPEPIPSPPSVGGGSLPSPPPASVGYPAAYFHRVPVRGHVVRKLLDRLRSDDVYRRTAHYPTPEHRGAAMAKQGALLYTLLFFQPRVLAEDEHVMAEIVNKHFYESWVVSYYLGFTVDLAVAWAGFPAAEKAIARAVSLDNVRYHQQRIRSSFFVCRGELSAVLMDGRLTEAYVLDNIFTALLPLVREANVALRWVLLHGTRGGPRQRIPPAHAASYALVRDGVTDGDIIGLLLQTAQLEFELGGTFTALLGDKRSRWGSARAAAAGRASKLAQYFSGEDTLSRDYRDSQLEAWFGDVAARIAGLEYRRGGGTDDTETHTGEDVKAEAEEDPVAVSRRRLQKLIKALGNVLEFSQVNTRLPVVESVQATRALLERMLRYVSIDREVVTSLATVGDFSYAAEQLAAHHYFVAEIQEKIRASPGLSVQMRSVFVKLAGMVALPCHRIEQACRVCASGDARRGCSSSVGTRKQRKHQYDPRLREALEATSSYYSAAIVAFVRRVLHVIPTAIFASLRHVMALLTADDVLLRDCPSKLPRQEMRAMSQLPTRQQLSTLTADIAKYAGGILAMESVRVGVINIDSRRLLEDGIRRELVKQVAEEVHNGLLPLPLPLPPMSSPVALDEQLHRLGQRLSGMRASFEYIQDYIGVHGLRIWNEEFARTVMFNADMEANAFVPRKVYPWNSRYQSESIPIPYHELATAAAGDSGSVLVTPTVDGGPANANLSSVSASTLVSSATPPPPPPSSPQPDPKGTPYGFFGELVGRLLALTGPATATFLSSTGSWYSRTTLTEVVGLRTFSSIATSVGPQGLHALDRLMCFMIAMDVRTVLDNITAAVAAPAATGRPRPGPEGTVADTLHALACELCTPMAPLCPEADREQFMSLYARLTDALASSLAGTSALLTRIGQLQSMRRMLSNELRSCAKLASGCLYAALRTANEALIDELAAPVVSTAAVGAGASVGSHKPHTAARLGKWAGAAATHRSMPSPQSAHEAGLASVFRVSSELTPYLDCVGIVNPLHQVFTVPSQQPRVPFLPLYLLALLVEQGGHITYDERFACCTPAEVSDAVDPASLLCGVAVLLRQFHASVADTLLTCLGQAVRSGVLAYSAAAAAGGDKDDDDEDEVLPCETETLAQMMLQLCRSLDRPQAELHAIIPPTLFGDFRH